MRSSYLIPVREAITRLHERGFQTRQDGNILFAQIDTDDEIPFAIQDRCVDSEALRAVLAAEDGDDDTWDV